ncbi:type II secretion system minor pseudopilin GspI [Cupriavidus gilardii]|uniref:Type II secretion system protein I n=1 Tax=Cupriavidus gilardii TaxID=82541 RepID=A0ABY4VWN0_9BURK|nr:type II secretion system minor pseudopilin GspI [Cupriavidus gilardii]MCT9117233.1 type II secretion system minor pseudopilin GspI [Cupriavidus gilardii]QQE06752.1 type II secretion system minor pseudopilin GspI [Cupriavidus sp. ISTL7]USE80339.1 type II secretion system minor pseudopilin GspI [Cupriavidus gilardii]
MIPHRCARLPRAGTPGRRPRGFTLIEVLVALTILAVALTAAMRAMGSMIEAGGSLQQRMLAGWSADNQLVALRLTKTWPEPGTRGAPCPQGGIALYCEQTVAPTPNPAFRRVEIAVYPSAEDRSVRLAWLVTIVPNETRNLL